MRDDDPRSLNDDFVRTFTISSIPKAKGAQEKEFKITIRNVGVVTNYLFQQNERAGFEVPVVGVGGEFTIEQKPEAGKLTPFIAGGVGITPLMAQAAAVLEAGGEKGLKLLWSLRVEDLPLAIDVLEHIRGLGEATKLFVTGEVTKKGRELIAKLQGLGVEVGLRRISGDDVLAVGEKGKRKFYCCTGPAMMKSLLKWTGGEDVVFESFEFQRYSG